MTDSGVADLLREIGAAISGELDLKCQILDARAGVPIDSLAVIMEPDRQGRPRAANLMFLPVGDDEVQEVHLLQLHCLLPLPVAAERRADLEHFLTRTNSIVPIGAFSITGDDELIFKHVYAIGRARPFEPREFLELFLLWMFTLDSLSGVVEDVAAGVREADVALAELG